MIKHYQNKKLRRQIRVRSKLNRLHTRLSVFRSHQGIYAQVIDDSKGKTLASASYKDVNTKTKLTKIEAARLVGEMVAKKALQKGVTTVAFDRGQYRYHGRVKAIAEGARSTGLQF